MTTTTDSSSILRLIKITQPQPQALKMAGVCLKNCTGILVMGPSGGFTASALVESPRRALEVLFKFFM